MSLDLPNITEADIAAQLRDLALVPDYVSALTATDQHWPAIIELIAPRGHIALIDDPQGLDIAPAKPKALTLSWEFMFTRSMFGTDANHRTPLGDSRNTSPICSLSALTLISLYRCTPIASTIPRSTPRSTRGANASVATSVPAATNACGFDWRTRRMRSANFRSPNTETSTMAASTAFGRSLSTGVSGNATSTAMPVTAPTQGLVAPAERFSALRENDPPTGNARVKPATTFAAPWPIISRLASHG